MKKDAHPKYYTNAKFTCECGNVVVTGSTLESYKVEICSACHPFYTGKQKLVDTAGRVEKFMAKRKKAGGASEESIMEKSEAAKKSKKDEKYLTVGEFKAIKEKEKDKAEKREVKKTGKGAAKAEPSGASKATEAKKTAVKKTAAKKPAAKKPTAKKSAKK